MIKIIILRLNTTKNIRLSKTAHVIQSETCDFIFKVPKFICLNYSLQTVVNQPPTRTTNNQKMNDHRFRLKVLNSIYLNYVSQRCKGTHVIKNLFDRAKSTSKSGVSYVFERTTLLPIFTRLMRFSMKADFSIQQKVPSSTIFCLNYVSRTM
jgi:hypothetical protein